MPNLGDILSAGAGAALQTGLGLPAAPVPPPVPVATAVPAPSPAWKFATFGLLAAVVVLLWRPRTQAKRRRRHVH